MLPPANKHSVLYLPLRRSHTFETKSALLPEQPPESRLTISPSEEAYAAFLCAGALRPTMPWPSSEGAAWPSSVMARVSTADRTLMVGRGSSRMAIVGAAT